MKTLTACFLNMEELSSLERLEDRMVGIELDKEYQDCGNYHVLITVNDDIILFDEFVDHLENEMNLSIV